MEPRRGGAGDGGDQAPGRAAGQALGTAARQSAGGGTGGGAGGGTAARWRSRRVLLLGAVSASLVVILLAIGLIVLRDGDDAPPTTHPSTTGVSWTSGANANPPNDLGGWEEWIGRPTDIAILFTSRVNWETVSRDDWPVSDFPRDRYPGQLSIAQPLFPTGSNPNGVNEGACARGANDKHWREFGRTLVRNGRGDAIVRIGWEFNGNWFKDWMPKDSGTWKVCFIRAVTALRSTAPQVQIEWNMTAHRDKMTNGDNVWKAYPGDEWVDIVGIDAYDNSPASVTQKLFNEQCNKDSGVCTVARFAREHGKRFAVSEWGLDRRADVGGGGDNPFYIEKMYEFFVANQDILAYEAYYTASPDEQDNVASSLHDPETNPRSAKRYLELFGGPKVPPAVTRAGISTSTP